MRLESGPIQTIIRILCDMHPSKPLDAAYLYAQTIDNQESVLAAARKILLAGFSNRILLLGGAPNSGYAGYTIWKEKLVELGIEEKSIFRVDLGVADHNTLTEAEAVVRYTKLKDFKSIIISAAPFHQIRAFMTTVRAALSEYPELKIYNIPGETLSWNEKATHSQGLLTLRRSDLIQGEFDRIDKYFRKGDLVSFDKALDYLDKRDHGTP